MGNVALLKMSSEAEGKMRPIDYQEGRELEKTHVCAVGGGGLVTAWHGEYVLKCAENQNHEGETKKQWAPMSDQPIEVQNVLKRKERNG